MCLSKSLYIAELFRSDIGPAREATDVSDERHAVPVKKKKEDDDEVVSNMSSSEHPETVSALQKKKKPDPT